MVDKLRMELNEMATNLPQMVADFRPDMAQTLRSPENANLVTGTFNKSVLDRIGFGSEAKRQTDIQTQMNNKLGEIRDGLRGGVPAVLS